MGKYVILKCKAEYVPISNITILPDGLDDNKGVALDRLHRGMTELYITDDVFAFQSLTLKSVDDTLTKIDQWKKKSLKPMSNRPVGLEIKYHNFMILHRNTWILLKIYGTSVSLFRADLIVDRGVFKVFTLKSPSSPVLSEDEKIVEVFRQLIRDQETK